MIELKITGENTYASDHLDQYDYGQVLRICGDLPSPVEVQFSLLRTGGEAPRSFGVEVDGAIEADIPDEMLRNNGTTHDYNIYAFLYVRNDTSGETTHRIIIPVKSRPKPGDFLPPDQPDYGEQLLAKVQNETQKALDAKETASRIAEIVAEDAKQVACDKKFVEENAGQIQENKNSIEKINETIEEHLTNHPSGGTGVDGKDGVGIQSVEQTTTSTDDGGTNIITVTKTDGSTSTFQVVNGSKGDKGDKGDTGEPGTDGYTPQKGVDYFDGADGTDGKDGQDGTPGVDGKSAYEYAQEGGYTGTEEEFYKLLSEDVPKISEKHTKPNGGIPASDLAEGVIPDVSNKLDKPETAQVGQIFRVKSINEDGTYVVEAVDMPSGGGSVDDVQINGSSIVDIDGVANIPIANGVKLGMVKVGYKETGTTSSRGLIIDTSTGLIGLYVPPNSYIKNRKDVYGGGGGINTANYDYAVKCAICDGIGDAWTEEEQAAAQERIGIKSVEEVLF